MTTSIGIGTIGRYDVLSDSEAINDLCTRKNLSLIEICKLRNNLFNEFDGKEQDLPNLFGKIYKNNPENYLKLAENSLTTHFYKPKSYQGQLRTLAFSAPLLHSKCEIGASTQNLFQNALRKNFPEVFDVYLNEINKQDYDKIRIPATARHLQEQDPFENMHNETPRRWPTDFIIDNSGQQDNHVNNNPVPDMHDIAEARLRDIIAFNEMYRQFHINNIAFRDDFNVEEDSDDDDIYNDNNVTLINNQSVGSNALMENGIGSVIEENSSEDGDPDEKQTEVHFPVTQETGPDSDPVSDYNSDEEVLYEDPPLKDRNENNN